jgi:hypothetical protein
MSTAGTSIKKLPVNITTCVFHLLLFCDNTILLGSHTVAFFMIRFHFIHDCFRSCVSKHFVAKGHTRYFGLFRGPRVEKVKTYM